MTTQRSILMAGVCLGLLTLPAFAQEANPAQAPAWAAEAIANPAYDGTVAPQGDGEYGGTVPADLGAGLERNDPGVAESGVSGVTAFFGDTAAASSAPFAAEAQANPDYNAAAEAAPAAAAEAAPASEPAADASTAIVANDPGEAPKGVPGVTEYYGDTAAASSAPFAAEATMNPDYSADAPAAAPAAAESAAVIANDPGEAPKGVPGVTEYYGDTTPASPPAWAAEAKMNTAGNEAAASPQTQEAVEACRDSLNTEAKTGILFASNKWDVLRTSYKTLDKIAKIASDCNASFVIEIGGHTDNVGTPAVNQQISELRARAVLSYLTGKGVDAAKLKAVGYGQTKPAAENGSADGRAKNRRIEFLVTAN